MASPRTPGQDVMALPKLTDPNNVQEVFVNHTVGVSITDGIVHVTFSVIRPKHNNPGGPSDNENVVALRLATPASTMANLIEACGHLERAMALQKTLKPN